MSVRMALAKLCACACGGALVGGGAVHVAETAQTQRTYVAKQRVVKRAVTRRVVARNTAVAGCARGMIAVRTSGSTISRCRVITRTTTTTTPAVVTVTNQGMLIPLPPISEQPTYGAGYAGGGGGGAAAAVTGGGGGYGGGGGGGRGGY